MAPPRYTHKDIIDTASRAALIRDAAIEMHANKDVYLLFAGKHIEEHGAKEEPPLETFELE